MDTLNTLPPCGPAGACDSGGLVDAVLRDVAALLAELGRDPAHADAIDLHSLPLTDDDRACLRRRLGQGEVDAVLDLAGPSRISETAYAGVWWLRHADADDRTQLEQIVVARVPALLLADPADIADAARRLGTELRALTAPEAMHD